MLRGKEDCRVDVTKELVPKHPFLAILLISSDKLTSHSLWVAGCNKGGGGGEELSTLKYLSQGKGLRESRPEGELPRREVSVKGEKGAAGTHASL